MISRRNTIIKKLNFIKELIKKNYFLQPQNYETSKIGNKINIIAVGWCLR